MDFEDEGAEEPDGEAWESEDDEGVEDGMEAQDDSEVTFSLHSGECWARTEAAGTPSPPWDLVLSWLSPESRGAECLAQLLSPSLLGTQSCPGLVSALCSGRRALWVSRSISS